MTIRNLLTGRRRKLVITFCLALNVASIFMWSQNLKPIHGGQGAGKRFEKSQNYPNEPLQIVDIKASKGKVRIGERFADSADWLKAAELTVKNVSGKDIVYIEIDLNFPETKASGNEMSFPLRAGSRPLTAEATPVILKSEDQFVLRLDDQKYNRLVRFIGERHQISDIGETVINVGFVIFSDGTAWGNGTSYHRDPLNPNRYIPNPM